MNSTMALTRYEDVKDITTEDYFEGNIFSIDAFNRKYALYEGETYVQAVKRVCDSIASVEATPELRKKWSEQWFDEIYNDWWHPAGSIMQGAGSGKNISLANCSTTSLGARDSVCQWDNLESIIRNTAYTVAKSAAYRQGQGIDFSVLRPNQATVQNSAKIGNGSIHWMKYIDSIGYYVGQQGRIPALLFSLNCKHPDVIEFIKAKTDFTIIQNANISVQCNDDFYIAAINDDDWELRYVIPGCKKGDKIYFDVHSALLNAQKDEKGYYILAARDREEEVISNMVKARDILVLIAKGMCEYAEPGVQNIDIAIRESNSDYVYDPKHEYDSRILSTNACSEQYLSRDSLCILSSINMVKFARLSSGELVRQLEKIGPSINRFLDNVNEYELVNRTFATPHQEMAIKALRRTGAGFTNMEAWLFNQGLVYGSSDGNLAATKFQEMYNYQMYKSSIEIGREKGSFGLFNREKFEKSPFIQRMKDLGLEFDAMRNVTCSSIAPTGSLSLMFRGLVLSYGIEKGFGAYYWKRTRISGKYEYYFNVPRIVRDKFQEMGLKIPMESDTIKDTWDGKHGTPIAKFIDENMEKTGLKLEPVTKLNIFDKLDLMCKVQKWVDSSMSTTYMLPETADWKDVYDFIILGWQKGLKSIAAFPDRKMYGIISYIPFKEQALKLIEEGQEIHPQNFTNDELKQLDVPIVTEAPKRRPKEIEGEVWRATAKGKEFLFFVGLHGGKPYEMFGGELPEFLEIKEGGKATMIKQLDEVADKKVYSLVLPGIEIKDFGSYFTPHEEAMFRAVSYMLQSGDDVDRVAKYLKGCSHREGIASLYSAARRVLLKYDDGKHKSTSYGKIARACPNCDSQNLYHEAGCIKCGACGWSKCE